MAHALKFKVGDVVTVVENNFDHGLEIGKEYTIVKAVLESRQGGLPMNYQEYKLDGGVSSWVAEADIQ